MACAYCNRKNFELIKLMEHELTHKFIIKRYPHIKITDVLCTRCYTSADTARMQIDLLNEKLNSSNSSMESISTIDARSLALRDISEGTNTLDPIDDIVYKTPQYTENIRNAERIHQDRDIGGTIGIQLYEARKNKTVNIADTPIASKKPRENQQLIVRLNAFVPSENEVQSVVRNNSISSSTSTSRINDEQFNSPPNKISKITFNSASNLISIENVPKDLTSNSGNTVSSTPKKTSNKITKELDRPMPKSVKRKLAERMRKTNEENEKQSPAVINNRNLNFHSSQEAGPSGVNKNVDYDLIEHVEDSDDEFLVRPVHTRPIIPKRKPSIVILNKDQTEGKMKANKKNENQSPTRINTKNLNFHSSQERSGINKNLANDLIENLEVSDDEFPDIQSLEPADSLVHTRPIIPRRKQSVVFSNKNVMDIYLARSTFGG